MWNVADPGLYDTEHVVVQHLYDSDHAALTWFGFKTGQTLKEHETSSTAIIEVLSGRVRLTATTEQLLATGQGVQLRPHERHALEALEDSVVQLLLVPHPRYHSLSSTVGLGSSQQSDAES